MDNKPLKLFYSNIQLKLFLCKQLNLIDDLINIIKWLSFKVLIKRIIYPPTKEEFDKHCIDFIYYTDNQGIVFKYETGLIYPGIFGTRIKNNFGSMLTFNFHGIVLFIIFVDDESFSVFVDYEKSDINPKFLYLNTPKILNENIQFDTQILPIPYQL